MKKVVMLVLALVLVGAVALAEVDLTGMSYEELVALRDQLDKTIWAMDEWEYVQVPGGDYDIGVDIPAGRWTLVGVDSYSSFEVYQSRDVKDNYSYDILYESLDHNQHYNITLEDGQYIEISGLIAFQPYLSAGLRFH